MLGNYTSLPESASTQSTTGSKVARKVNGERSAECDIFDDSAKTIDLDQPLKLIEPGRTTFRVCAVGLALLWIAGLGTLIGGAIVQATPRHEGDDFAVTIQHHRIVTPLVQLAMAFAITGLSDVAGLIHSTSLRFTLLASRKLIFNSNLRLFATCPNAKVHWWPVNVIWAWSLISSYACGSMIIVPSVYTSSGEEDNGAARDIVSGLALIFLGLGLLGQASIATWALLVTKIPTWSTNPIHTAKVCVDLGWLTPLSKRTMVSVHEANDLPSHQTPALPKPRQSSLLTAHPSVRRAIILCWTVTLLAFLWFVAITIAYQVSDGYLGPTWASFSRSYTNYWGFLPRQDSARVTAFLGISTSLGQSFYTFWPWFVCKYLLTCLVLGGIVLNLHVVEILAQCSRDESLWRLAAAPSGLHPRNHGAFHVAFTSWETVVLFAFKTLTNWIFGLAFGIFFEGIEIRIPQVCYTAIALFWLAAWATALALWRPKGPQPATFGHLPTLVDLIDVWPCRVGSLADEREEMGEVRELGDAVALFWGDKGEDGDGVRRAGTAYAPLKGIVMTAEYL